MTNAELLELLQAQMSGKIIQQWSDYYKEWNVLTEEICNRNLGEKYRVKPEEPKDMWICRESGVPMWDLFMSPPLNAERYREIIHVKEVVE